MWTGLKKIKPLNSYRCTFSYALDEACLLNRAIFIISMVLESNEVAIKMSTPTEGFSLILRASLIEIMFRNAGVDVVMAGFSR